jgi:hypothetical protein
MIDLERLKASAQRTDSESAVVSRRFLARVAAEIEAGRAAHERLGQVFGLNGKAL